MYTYTDEQVFEIVSRAKRIIGKTDSLSDFIRKFKQFVIYPSESYISRKYGGYRRLLEATADWERDHLSRVAPGVYASRAKDAVLTIAGTVDKGGYLLTIVAGGKKYEFEVLKR